VYDVDPETFSVLDYTVYYANMSLPHYQIDGSSWQRCYPVKETYRKLLDIDPKAELSPAFLE
jgi:sphingomyelin phosphodiesterase